MHKVHRVLHVFLPSMGRLDVGLLLPQEHGEYTIIVLFYENCPQLRPWSQLVLHQTEADGMISKPLHLLVGSVV